LLVTFRNVCNKTQQVLEIIIWLFHVAPIFHFVSATLCALALIARKLFYVAIQAICELESLTGTCTSHPASILWGIGNLDCISHNALRKLTE